MDPVATDPITFSGSRVFFVLISGWRGLSCLLWGDLAALQWVGGPGGWGVMWGAGCVDPISVRCSKTTLGCQGTVLSAATH